jgi:hydroxyethylthiazole kinase
MRSDKVLDRYIIFMPYGGMTTMNNALAAQWKLISEKHPYVHQLTNFVTVNDCANMTLAAGGSPIMTLAPDEVEQIVSVCQALVINIGTLNHDFLTSAVIAGKAANKHGIPVVLDPVGVGASDVRKQSVELLLQQVKFAVIRGNRSEIMTLTGFGSGKGVDADPTAAFHPEQVMELARDLGSVISASGPVDFVTDGETVVEIANGHPLLADVSGTGCMTASITGCCLGAGIQPLDAAALALTAMGIAGERAADALGGERRLGSYRQRLIDEVAMMSEQTICTEGKASYAQKAV